MTLPLMVTVAEVLFWGRWRYEAVGFGCAICVEFTIGSRVSDVSSVVVKYRI